MANPQSTSILIRVQARGGKFLGPGVAYSQVSVWNGSQMIFGPALASGDSGTVDSKTGDRFIPTASRNVIAVLAPPPGPPDGAYWLTPNNPGQFPPTSAGVLATFPLAAPALLEFRATALYDSPNPVTASAMMWVYPGMQLTSEPGLLLTIPGLNVSLQPEILGVTVKVTATVTMMCGCPITIPTWPPTPTGPEPYWPDTEFQVMAVLTPPSGPATTKPMIFTGTNTFNVAFPLPPPGLSTLGVYALQQAESNVGYAQTTLAVGGT